MTQQSNSNQSYISDSAQGCFEALKFHKIDKNQSFVEGSLSFNYALNSGSRRKDVVDFSYLTIRGLDAFGEAVKKLSNTRGCYVLYNSFTHKVYVGKAEGSNSESLGLLARLTTHKNQPKLEFDTIFCVYVPIEGIQDNLSLAFNGQFLSYMEASLYKAIVNVYSQHYSNFSEFIINQALNPIAPQNHVHLHALVDDYAINSLLDWMAMTGFSVNPLIQPISKQSISAAVPSSVSGVGGGGVVIAAPAVLPGVAVSAKTSSGVASSTSLKQFDFSNLPRIVLKNPITGRNTNIECASASEAFQEITAHIINCALSVLSKPQRIDFLNKLSSSLTGWVKYEGTATIQDFSQKTANITTKIKELDDLKEVRVCVNYNNSSKINKLNQLVTFLSLNVSQFTAFKLSDFVS